MRLSAIGLMLTLALGVLVAPLAAEAQPLAKVPHVGVLSSGSPLPAPSQFQDAFRQGLHALGYVEGQNIVLEYRFAEYQYDRLPALAAELVRLRVDVIVAQTAPAIQAAQHATRTIPIVIETLTDPVLAGFVTSLAQPGGNITGVVGLAPEVGGKQLELLKEAVPGVRRVALLANPENPNAPAVVHEIERAAHALGLEVHRLAVREASELASAFATMVTEQVDALLVLPDPMLAAQRRQIVDFAAAHRLPAMYAESKVWTEVGGLMSYGPSGTAHGRRVAHYVERILKGAKPADLPVERSMQFELVINLKTATALGLTIPPTVLFQADEVIQ